MSNTKNCAMCEKPIERPKQKSGYFISESKWKKIKYCSRQCRSDATAAGQGIDDPLWQKGSREADTAFRALMVQFGGWFR